MSNQLQIEVATNCAESRTKTRATAENVSQAVLVRQKMYEFEYTTFTTLRYCTGTG